MYHQAYLEAIETVLNWDLPEESLADAISQQFTFINHQAGESDDQDALLQ